MSDSNENNNALNGQVILDGGTASSKELYDTHKNLTRDIWATWGQHRDAFAAKAQPDDHRKFARISIVSVTQVAATLAVDLSMSEEQFMATCKANYAAAVKRAPRWA